MNKSNDKIRILAIESSCDETAAAVISVENNQPVILSNVISSQIDLHAKTGGVVPEVASRAHMEAMVPVVVEALIQSVVGSWQSVEETANCKLQTANFQQANDLLAEITHIAVTAGPGLIGSLMVGFNAAKTLAYGKNLPIIPINHIEGHIYSAVGRGIPNSQFPISNQLPIINNQLPITSGKLQFPLLALTVSGGHTSMTLMRDHGQYEYIGGTVDDAVGEAYDKVAKLLGLGYPGGPVISKLASEFRRSAVSSQQSAEKTANCQLPTINHITFPRPMINDGTFKFSFSGLKTAVLQKVKDILKDNNLDSVENITKEMKEEIAAAFEEAVADVLCFKAKKAIEQYLPKTVIFAGGVSANAYLKSRLQSTVDSCQLSVDFLVPLRDLSGDNAAMIGTAAYYRILRGEVSSWDKITVDANWELV